VRNHQGDADRPQRARAQVFLRECARVTAGLAAAAAACLLPVFALGGNYFECGDAMMKYSTIAYLADSPLLENLAAGLLGVYTLALAILLSRFVPSRMEERSMMAASRRVGLVKGGSISGSIGDNRGGASGRLYEPLLSLDEDTEAAFGAAAVEENQEEENEAHAGGHVEEKANDEEGSMHDLLYDATVRGGHESGEEEEKTRIDEEEEEEDEEAKEDLPSSASSPLRLSSSSDLRKSVGARGAAPTTRATSTGDRSPKPGRAVLFVLVWASCLIFIGGGPTVLYVMTYSLPADSTISKSSVVPEFLQSVVESVLSGGLALYLSIFSSFILPALTTFTVRRMLAALRGGNQHQWQTAMAIVARTLLVVVVPCVAVLIF
jgi:hypothetical protein